MNGPQIAWLADGKRLHLNHGPIDLIIETFGREIERRAAYGAAIARFQTILEELVAELAELRKPVGATPRRFAGPTANRMERAVQKFHPEFITPMAAVAGSVADEIMAAMLCCCRSRQGLRQQWRRHRHPPCAWRRDARRNRRHRPRLCRPPRDPRGRSGARHRHQRLARPQLFTGHRRCGDGAGQGRGSGRRRGDADRQRRRPAGASARLSGSRQTNCRPTAISASDW